MKSRDKSEMALSDITTMFQLPYIYRITKGLGLYQLNEYPTRTINKRRENLRWVGIGKN